MKSSNMQSYSQFGEDLWIVEHLSPPIGYFCDVGAYDGIESSNTYLFERLGWEGVCIEAHPESAQKCAENRHCRCWAGIISSKNERVDFHYHPRHPGLSGILSEGDPRSLPALPLHEVWDMSFPLPVKMNLLSIDTEGSELAVWEGAKRLRPDIVIVEYLTLYNPPVDRQLVDQFTQDGYREVHRTQANLIFTLDQ